MYIKEAIVTGRKMFVILKALLKVCLFLIQQCAYFTSIREQPFLKQSTGYIREIKPLFHLKQTKYLCNQLKL